MRTVEQQTQTLADYLPSGKLFRSKNINDSTFRSLLRGLAAELYRADGTIYQYKSDINPSVTTNFIDEWEEALGIPDGCFSGAGSVDERRKSILIKLASLGVQTATDFELLGDMFGVSVSVNSGRAFSVFPLTFPVLLFNTEKEARFTIVVDFTVEASNSFPLIFPFIFGTAEVGILECLFRKLKPSNCDIIFRQV